MTDPQSSKRCRKVTLGLGCTAPRGGVGAASLQGTGLCRQHHQWGRCVEPV